MNNLFRQKRIITLALCLSLIFAAFGPLDLIPEARAASQASLTRLVKKLKRQVKKLKRQLRAARRPAPVPVPFIEMVTVGNVGNAADPEDGDSGTGGVQNYGAVPYEFQIGKYEVSLDEYTRFLNAVAATDTYNLYNTNMATNLNIAGIERSAAEPYTYTVIGSGKRPVTYVSWFDAARFCNWLHNGRPSGAQDVSTTEDGAYGLFGVTSGVEGLVRGPLAKYWIPSEDEWYKAAYHQPSGQSGDSDDYWLYPTGSNGVSGNDIGPSPLANHANYRTANSFYSVTQSASYIGTQNYLTDGGAYEGSSSYYGTFDQGGNVREWNDAVIISSFRGLRGGSWDGSEFDLRSSFRYGSFPDDVYSFIGFRVASP